MLYELFVSAHHASDVIQTTALGTYCGTFPAGEEAQSTAGPPLHGGSRAQSSRPHFIQPNLQGLRHWRTHRSPEEVTPTTDFSHSTAFSCHIQLELTNNY